MSTTPALTGAHAAACPAPRGRRRRVVLVSALLAAGASLVGSAAFAAFDATDELGPQPVSTARIAVDLADANGTSFTTLVPNLVPGDYFYRYIDLTYTGTSASQSVVGTVSMPTSSVAALPASFTIAVDECAAGWTSAGACTAGATSVKAATALSTAPAVTWGTFTSTAPRHFRATVKLDPSAPNTLQNATGTIRITASSTLVGDRDRTAG